MLRLRPERFVAGGDALARDPDGRIVFVRGALPGEDVSVEVTDSKRDWSRARVVEVYEASGDRVEPPCIHRREGCGGCDWQHLDESSQLPYKAAIVVDALRRTAKLAEPLVRSAGSVPARGYRTTIRVVGDAHHRAAFRMERSNATVPANGCLVAHPALVPIIDELVVATDLEVTLRVSQATGECTALWDSRGGQVRGLPSHVAVGPEAAVHERVGGHTFRVSAGSFFQSGPAAAELLIEAVKRAGPELADASCVLDAYAGVGLLALAATGSDSGLIAVESSRASADDCAVNLAERRARVERIEFGRWKPARGERIDVVIADPSRTGLGKPGVGGVVAAGAPVVVLVSCDPVSLARDAALLAGHGYRHDATDVLDLFPGTHHVEAVTRFRLAD